MKISIDQINKAFTPKQEVRDPKQFVGRYEEVKKSLKFLNADGSFLIIYGLRGLGKSSLGNQIKLIAEGDNVLLTLCQLTKFKPKNGFNYFVHMVRCDDYVKDIPALIKRIVLGDECNTSLYSHLKSKDAKELKALEFFAKRDAQKSKDDEDDKETISNDLIQVFRQALNVIRKDNQDKSGIIIMIDEFDLIINKATFASLVKSLSNDFIKFAVIGIADDIHDLVQDHASIARQIEPIEIGLMSEDDLKLIIKHAEEEVDNEITFSEEAKHIISTEANGFPYFVHLIGKEALLLAFERDLAQVDVKLINECREQIKNGLSNSVHEKNYVLASTSYVREKVLRHIAEHNKNYILVEDIYAEIKDLYKIDKPSKYLLELIEVNEGAPILKITHKGKLVRFTDPLFKLYITMREPIFSEDK